jgi:S1-C subfamily serine protease
MLHPHKSTIVKIAVSAGLALLVWAGGEVSPPLHAYYGIDDRVEVFQLSGENLADADSVVALFPEYNVQDRGDGTSELLTMNYGQRFNLCPSERFREQPSGSFCSGVLVAPDIIATAAHCITEMNVADIRFVFGYHMRDQSTPNLVINNSDIYQGVAVIGWHYDHFGADYALIQLDRMAVNHHIAHIRESGTINDGQAVHVIGHPKGLPVKFAGGAVVRENRYQAFFIANLDTYRGNSGSPVFNSTTHEVEGILVRGKGDEFVKQGECSVSRVCPDASCRGEDSTRTTEFVHLLAWLQ